MERGGTNSTIFLFHDNDNDYDYDGVGIGIDAALNALDEQRLVDLLFLF